GVAHSDWRRAGPPVGPAGARHRAGGADHAPGVRLRAAPIPHVSQHTRHPGGHRRGGDRGADHLGAADRAARRGRIGGRAARGLRGHGVLCARPRRQHGRGADRCSGRRCVMPFPPPALDDRRFADLVDELRRRIPVYTSEWTDHSPSDPGMTLLDLMAFLGENVLYRFNQIPDATRAYLLRLLAVPLHPAQPATGLVVCTPTAPGIAPNLESSFVVKAGNVRFETNEDVTALPVTCAAAAKVAAPAPTDADLLAASEAALDALGAAADAAPLYYATATLSEDPAAP